MASANILVSKRTARPYHEDKRGHLGRMSKRNSIIQEDSAAEAAVDRTERAERDQAGWIIDMSIMGGDVVMTKGRVIEPSVTDEKKGSHHNHNPDKTPFPTISCRPVNFGVVVPGVYRCSYPKPENYTFIRELGLKSIVSLSEPDEPDTALGNFVASNGIAHHVMQMRGTKKEAITLATMKSILHIVLDQRNHPVLVHCSHGKHRTGCVVGVVRKLSGWQVQPILEEYRTYAEPKIRECDVEYLTNFQTVELTRQAAVRSTMSINPVRARGFCRVALVTVVVLVIWALSAIKMSATVPSQFARQA